MYTQRHECVCACTHKHTHTLIHTHAYIYVGIGVKLAGNAIMYHLYTGLAKIDLGLKDIIIMSA